MKTALHRSSGVALVVTLILLAIITFMTVTFLVLSRAQKGMVASSIEQAKAADLAKLALRRGVVEAIAPVKAFNSLGAIDLRVSTNYNLPGGYQTGQPVPYPGISFNPLNVSYAYPNGQPVTGNDYLQLVENLYYSPRAPVYVATNRLYPNAYDFRWYLDLNRNGRFETNGWLPELDNLGQPIYVLDAQGNKYYPLKFFVGDPEWIGVLEKPEYHHSATNLFVGRIAYVIQPVSKTLDVNYAHNYAKGAYAQYPLLQSGNPVDGFMRNQGASTFEINLAGFLADLNTNYWPMARNTLVNSYWWPTPNPPSFAGGYAYNPVTNTSVTPSGGWAFTHAMGLVRYRYATSQANLQSVSSLFGPAGNNALGNNFVDDFAAGPLMTGTWWPVAVDGDTGPLARGSGWSGSYNPYHFFTPQDLLDTTKTTTVSSPFNLTTCLLSAGAGSNSYNRYTYYRMLAQLGSDTGPGDPENARINLNYVNVDGNGNIVPNLATNFWAWDPTQFFTNTVNRLLQQGGLYLRHQQHPDLSDQLLQRQRPSDFAARGEYLRRDHEPDVWIQHGLSDSVPPVLPDHAHQRHRGVYRRLPGNN